MMIINRTTKAVQSQSHRIENWMGDDWAEVPAALVEATLAAAPYCSLSFDEQGALTGVTAEEKPADYAAQAEALKRTLSETDYQIIKCSEYQLSGQTLPYDMEVLHLQRQTIRDEINALEAKLST